MDLVSPGEGLSLAALVSLFGKRSLQSSPQLVVQALQPGQLCPLAVHDLPQVAQLLPAPESHIDELSAPHFGWDLLSHDQAVSLRDSLMESLVSLALLYPRPSAGSPARRCPNQAPPNPSLFLGPAQLHASCQVCPVQKLWCFPVLLCLHSKEEIGVVVQTLRHYSSSCLSAKPTQLGCRVCQLVPESPPLSPHKPSREVLASLFWNAAQRKAVHKVACTTDGGGYRA